MSRCGGKDCAKTWHMKCFAAQMEGHGHCQILKFAQEKYSNGETAMQMLTDILEPDNLYLLDEPEVSLSPNRSWRGNQSIVRFLSCQFIASRSFAFMYAERKIIWNQQK